MIMKYREKQPKVAETAFVAETAVVIGDVVLEEGVSVWFGTVIRGDKDIIHIGKHTNVQDNCTLHTDPTHELRIGERVTVGHNAILHGAQIEDEVLIGMGAIILNGARIGKHCIIGAGTLIKEYQKIPENSVVVGCPGKIVKNISEEQLQDIIENAEHYVALGQEYQVMCKK